MPNIIVIGASAGGVEPLRELVRALPPDLQAAVFIVMHLSPVNPSVLPNILRVSGRIKVSAALDCQPIEPAHVCVARPNLHLLVEPGYVRLSRGPRENQHRPAVDPLFRSAARSYGPRVIGIVMTGMLDDGTLGLHIVKAEGGIAIVQDPREAMYDSMPRSAMKTVDVDYVLRVAEIQRKITEIVREPWHAVEFDDAAAGREEQAGMIRDHVDVETEPGRKGERDRLK